MAALDPYQQSGGRPSRPQTPLSQPPSPDTPAGLDRLLVPVDPNPGAASPGAGPTSQSQPPPATLARPPAVGDPVDPSAVRIDVETENETTEVAQRAMEDAPAWLISTVFHMSLMILLGLLLVTIEPRQRVELHVENVYAEQLGEQLEFDSPLWIDPLEAAEEPVLTPEDLPPVVDPFAAPAMLDIHPDGTMATSDVQANQIGLALSGRKEGSKQSLLGRYGGNATTEAAVQRGLRWLARNQKGNGSWSLAGPYSRGVREDFDNSPTATAMALLAFQGAGNTHQQGKFRRNVLRGWRWLLKHQDADGNFFHEGPFNHRYYTQGQCTIALCELYGMTKDPKYRAPAERAVQNCLTAQSPKGGWRYRPAADSDVSVSGWIVMALQSARMAGLDVPQDNFDRVTRYLDVIGENDGARYPYQRGHQTTVPMTAEAILMRQYLGWPRDHPAMIDAMEWITAPENLIDYKRNRNVYYWYYATQAAHHMEGDCWTRWNGVMRQAVPEHQVKEGREAGSWDPERPARDRWAPNGGRLYVTCLSIYMLEVYYRHLPIYTKVYTKLRQSGRTDKP